MPKSNKIITISYFGSCFNDDEPDDSLVDQVGGRKREQELGSVGRLLLLHRRRRLLLVDLLLGLLGDALEWVSQVYGEERAVGKRFTSQLNNLLVTC